MTGGRYASLEAMRALAVQAWGEPNRSLSSAAELRFGSNGSKSVDLNTSTFYDHEAGAGGGFRDLYKLVHGAFPENSAGDGQFRIPAGMRRQLGEPVGSWDYEDERGGTVARVVRFEPPGGGKTFRQCRPDAGGWKWWVKGLQIPLYRLPELLAAPADATVFITEGEKHADVLRAWGLTATTNIMGAGKFCAHHAKTLAGRDVVVLPDNDAAGRAHAVKVRQELAMAGCRVRVVDLPGLPEKGDVVDWIAAGGTAAALAELIREAPEPEPQPEKGPPDDAETEAEVARLARLSALKYARSRTEAAKALGLRVGILDRLVALERGGNGGPSMQGRPIEFTAPAPWPEPVNGAALLVDLAGYFSRHAVLPERANLVLALWSVHCHVFERFPFTPRMLLKSATKGSGKSTVLELLADVVPKAQEAENVSAAFMFRIIEAAKPTMLVDEIDSFLRDNPEIRSILNAGVKPGATVGRCVGDAQEPRLFGCHAPVALAGIGNSLHGTTLDRCIVLNMKRRLRSEAIEPIEESTKELAKRLQRQAARWTRDNAGALSAARPDMQPLFNRAALRWRALYAIAEVAGDNWPDLVRAAMQALSTNSEDADSLGEQLLADVRAIFVSVTAETATAEAEVIGATDEEIKQAVEAAKAEMFRKAKAEPARKAGKRSEKGPAMSTAEIVERLVAMQDRPWPEMPRTGKALTTASFTRMIKPFGPSRQRLVDDKTGRPGDWGWRLADFIEAFERYLDA